MRRPKPAPGSPNTRDQILDAAQRVAAKRGAGHVTLDAVAQESGLSKGGVLYHFPNKDALINGMLERLLAQNTAAQERAIKTLDGPVHRTLRSILTARQAEHRDLNPDVAMAVLAAAAEKPQLLDPMRAHIRQRYAQLAAEDQARQAPQQDLDLVLLMLAAADGLLFQDLLALSPLTPDHKERLNRRLLELTEELLS
ncbi:TetR/AcrR family transcriptional regulator [Alcanivorax sp. JB21]|uniref:TetR/AcrR family transcriptional regulator n=1 Tax=Alcanivorax limicola TaxID=2874102 RepID=UPI001CBEF380|nr:TetR/AcrR family transcriptional regulator [Alcanivorax limicola]MBZ2188673.1 TetR/AcrR family transcriptional regulator [Alcanivorax limicola]